MRRGQRRVDLRPSLHQVHVARGVLVLQVVVQVWDQPLVAVAVLLWRAAVSEGTQTLLRLPGQDYNRRTSLHSSVGVWYQLDQSLPACGTVATGGMGGTPQWCAMSQNKPFIK